jgi:hypothetical protein
MSTNSSDVDKAKKFYFGSLSINLSEFIASLLLKNEMPEGKVQLDLDKLATDPNYDSITLTKKAKLVNFLQNAKTNKRLYYQITDAIFYILVIFLVVFFSTKAVDIQKFKAYSKRARTTTNSTLKYILKIAAYPLFRNSVVDNNETKSLKELEKFLEGKKSEFDPSLMIEPGKDAKDQIEFFIKVFSQNRRLSGLFQIFVQFVLIAVLIMFSYYRAKIVGQITQQIRQARTRM